MVDQHDNQLPSVQTTVGLSEKDEPTPRLPAEFERDDRECWVCGAQVEYRKCKIVCPRCGFTRDCSDP